MPVVSVTLPNDGDEALVEPYNAAINAILGVINGQIDSSNILAGSIPWSAMSAAISNAIPASAMLNSGNLELFRSEVMAGAVASGMVWSTSSGLVGTMTAGVYYSPNGIRNIAALIASFTFTANKDTYIDFPSNGGSPSYTAVANGATSGFTLAANYVRVAKVVTGASAITSIIQIGSDGVGNIIYPVGPVSVAETQNPCKFSAYLTTGTNFTNGSWAATVFNALEYDTGGNYSVSTGRYTITIPGFYDFAACLSHNNVGSDAAGIAFYKNGAVCKQGGIVTAPNASVQAVVKDLQLAVGDYIQVFNSTTTAGLAITANQSQAYFMGGLASRS